LNHRKNRSDSDNIYVAYACPDLLVFPYTFHSVRIAERAFLFGKLTVDHYYYYSNDFEKVVNNGQNITFLNKRKSEPMANLKIKRLMNM